MTTLGPDDRHHIEERLGRALTDEDLAEVATIDDLSREQLAIVARLERSGLLASAYVRAVVPSAAFPQVRDLVFTIQDVIARKLPPARLRMEDYYGPQLGRPLTDEERRVVYSIPDLTSAQRAVARRLASGERVYALLYLGDVVKSSATHEREALIDALLRDGDR